MILLRHALVACLKAYRYAISPATTYLFGPSAGCRFEPTCSAYAIEAVQTHGAPKGVWLASRRVLRCHPWGGCGCDPVPSRPEKDRPLRFRSR